LLARAEGLSIGARAAERRRAMNVEAVEQRAVARRKAQEAAQLRDYAAARINRLSGDWVTSILSADQSLKGDLRLLRGASRSLVRDNSFATRYTNLLVENIVGHQGIQLQARMMSTRGKMSTKANQQLEDAWLEWGFAENASANGRLSWIDLQSLFWTVLPTDGESCFRILRGYENEFRFALEPLDADLLDETINGLAPNGNEIRMGVEVNDYGRPLAYWMWTRHPSDTGPLSKKRAHVRVDANDIIHEFSMLRPGQSRGVPWFTPVLIDQKMLQGYQEAEITAARWGASNMAKITYDPEKGGGSLAVAQPGASAIPQEVEPARIVRLGPGEDLEGTNFNHPNTAFAGFTKEIQRSIATGLNVAYTSLSGNLEAVNYSSIRAGLLGERDFYRRMQVWTAHRFSRRVFREWVVCAALADKLPAQLTDAILAPTATKWRPRGWPWVDPRNDIEAAHLEIALGVNSRTNIAGDRGRDFEETVDDLELEQEIADEAGVSISPIGLTVKGQSPNNDPGGQNDSTPSASGAAPADTSNSDTSQGASDGEQKPGRSRLRVTG
jgi:lambda family phage portal protein